MKTKISVGRIQYNFHIFKQECDNKILYCKMKNHVISMSVQLLLGCSVFVCVNLAENISVARRFTKRGKTEYLLKNQLLLDFSCLRRIYEV